MPSNTRPATPAALFAMIALLALLLSLLGGTAAVATDDDTSDDPTCAPDEASDETPDETDASSENDDCEDDDDHKGGKFKDVPKNLPHVDGISWLESTGVTKGCKQGRFCPNKPVTRAEFATLAARLLGEVDDIEPVVAPADELEALQDRVAELEAIVADLQAHHP